MSASALSILTQIFYEPKAAFEELKKDSRLLLPLMLLPIATAAIMFWYFSTVDFAWYMEHMMSATPDMKPEQREVMARMFSKDSMMMMAVAGTLIGAPIVYALYALYYLIASKMMGSVISFGNWLAFAAWTSVPALLGLPLMALQIVSSKGQVAVEGLNMLSFNFLIFHFPFGTPWASLANSLNVTTIWSLFLSYVGFRVWTGRSVVASILVSTLPFIVIYGVWVAKIVFFK
jgi:hypothetical protein